jgi:hypothetical protein
MSRGLSAAIGANLKGQCKMGPEQFKEAIHSIDRTLLFMRFRTLYTNILSPGIPTLQNDGHPTTNYPMTRSQDGND